MKKNKITVLLATCNRYDTTLPLCLMSIINQSYLPDRVVLVDDSLEKRFYEYKILKNILILLKERNIEFDYFYGDSKGAVPALQLGLDNIEDGWVLKTDDDNVLPYNALELFTKNIKPNIGAMSGIIIDHHFKRYQQDNPDKVSTKIDGYYNCIENIYTELNIQMVVNQTNEIKSVQHLYSNYFFRREVANNYPEELQPSSHREETIFTYNIFREGFDLIVIPKIKINHLSYEENTGNNQWAEIHRTNNELFFIEKLKEWGIVPDKLKIIKEGDYLLTQRGDILYKVAKLN